MGQSGRARSLTWNPNPESLWIYLSQADSDRLFTCDLATGTLAAAPVLQIKPDWPSSPQSFSEQVVTLFQNRRLARGYFDFSGRVEIHQIADPTQPRLTLFLGDNANPPAFDPSGEWLICGTQCTASIWNASTGRRAMSILVGEPHEPILVVKEDGKVVSSLGSEEEQEQAKKERLQWVHP